MESTLARQEKHCQLKKTKVWFKDKKQTKHVVSALISNMHSWSLTANFPYVSMSIHQNSS